MRSLSKKNLQSGEVILNKPQLHAIILLRPVFFLFGVALMYGVSKMALSSHLGLPAAIVIAGIFIGLGIIGVIGAFGIMGSVIVLGTFGILGTFVIVATLVTMTAAFVFMTLWNLFLVSIVIAMSWFVIEVMRFCLEEYYITNKRLVLKQILRDGAFFSMKDIPIHAIESVHYEQDLLGSLLNFGTVSVAGVGGIHLQYCGIEKPHMVRRKVCEVIEKNRAVTIIKEQKPRPVVAAKQTTDAPIEYGTFVSLYPAE
jgi:hypothetical protein